MIQKTNLKKLLLQPRLYLTSASFQLLGVMILWPLFGWLVRWWLSWTGEPAVTDQAIAGFLLSPMGALGGFMSLSIGLAIIALELTGLIAGILTVDSGYQIRSVGLIRFSLSQFNQTLKLVLLIVVRGLIWLAPFIILVGVVAWWLLSEHDINFYLSERPVEFYWAIGIATVIGVVATFVLLPMVLSWSLALPVMLIQSVDPQKALKISRQMMGGKTFRVSLIWLTWLIIQMSLAALLVSIVYRTAQLIVGNTPNSLPVLIPLLGMFAAIWSVGNFLLSLFRSVSFASVAVGIYDVLAKQLPDNASLKDSFNARPQNDFFHRLGATPIESSVQLRDQDSSKKFRGLTALKGRTILLLAGCLGMVAIISGLLLLRDVKSVDDIDIIAHRGASAQAPDNSMAAFELAIAQAADYVELDVQESADGEVIVFHDQDFMKSSGIPARVWETTYEQMSQFDIGSRFDPRFEDQRVPTLTDALRLCKNRIRVMIELKSYGREQQLVERVAKIVEQESMVDQIVWMSLKPDLVRQSKQYRPEWTAGLLAAVAVGDLTKTNHDFLAVNANLATRSFVQRARQRGVKVYVWTINDSAAMAHYFSLGVDGIITDHPDIARELLDQYQALGLVDRLLLDAAIRIGVIPLKIQPTPAEES